MSEEKSMFEQNLELWEKFVNKNMDLMFKTMEKTMEGSKAFEEQMTKAVDRAVKDSQTVQERVSQTVEKTIEGSQTLREQVSNAVTTALTAQLEATRITLKAMERQLDTLSEKMDELVESQKKQENKKE
jgi:translation elongation factor EF-G